MTGRIFDIQRYSVHDGPGIRTTVFVAGCNLRCFWCHNPEALETKERVFFNKVRCIGCGECIRVCTRQCHRHGEEGHIILRDQCTCCGSCVRVCWSGALSMTSSKKEVDEILKTVLLDKPFYKHSGGMTVSGGEPLLQTEFVVALLSGAKKEGIHTAVDTAGDVPFTTFLEVIPYTDIFLYDLKCMDEELHRSVTGISNRRILENLKKLSKTQAAIIVRIPVVPGVNNSAQNMSDSANFLKKLGGNIQVELLTFHGFGSGKYESLGLAYQAEDLIPCTEDEMRSLAEPFLEAELLLKVS